MSFGYAKKLSLKVWQTNVDVQKIDSSALKILEMVIAYFWVKDKATRPKFFQKIFFIADNKYEVILGMFFLKLSNVNMSFDENTFT